MYDKAHGKISERLGHQTLRGYKSVFHCDYWWLIWIDRHYYSTAKEGTAYVENRVAHGVPIASNSLESTVYVTDVFEDGRNTYFRDQWTSYQAKSMFTSCDSFVAPIWTTPSYILIRQRMLTMSSWPVVNCIVQLYSSRSLGGVWKLPLWVQLAWCHLEIGIPYHNWGLQAYPQSSRASRRSHLCQERDNLMEFVLIRPSCMDSRKTNADTIEDIYLLSHIDDLLDAPVESVLLYTQEAGYGFGKQVWIKVQSTKPVCYEIWNVRVHDGAFGFTNTPAIFQRICLAFSISNWDVFSDLHRWYPNSLKNP